MDEMTLLRNVAEDTALPDTDRLAPARARLLAAVQASAIETPAAQARREPHTALRRSWIRSLRWGAVGLAAALAAVVALPAVRGGQDDSPGARPTFPATAGRPAEMVLAAAAESALAESDVVPRGDQFHYRRRVGKDGQTVDEQWLSMAPARNGLVIRYDAGKKTRIPLQPCTEERNGCGSVKGAYLPDLPTDTDQMRAFLRDFVGSSDPAESLKDDVGDSALSLLNNHHLRPAQRAAVFRAMAKTPGLQVIEGSRDASGRIGTGIAWTAEHTQGQPYIVLIFDERTGGYLGTAETALMSAVVDRIEQRP
jgi:hypothetical protein